MPLPRGWISFLVVLVALAALPGAGTSSVYERQTNWRAAALALELEISACIRDRCMPVHHTHLLEAGG